MKITLITLVLLSSLAITVQAAVYKHVDEEGNVIRYSDVPQKAGDEPMKVPPPALEYDSNTPASVPEFKPVPSSPGEAQSEDRKPVTAYMAVTILNIQNDEGIRANGGIFAIQLASQPALDTEAGHRYVVLIDGAAHQKSDSVAFQLENLQRGTHSINVQIEDRDGSVLTSSSPITIHVLRR
ncbi:MAG: DUF4124 domain-containing protein [Gammaproteobacteria bacterium]|nr:DUF4124 domain-containing protein [Gammaproteobacteria bacterium]